VHKKFEELLHQYKKDVFNLQHNHKDVDSITKECMVLCEDVLRQKYHYHFHRLPDANRAEIINMINNYTREAILPPVVEKIAQRLVLQDRRLDAMQHLIETMLEVLSTAPVARKAVG